MSKQTSSQASDADLPPGLRDESRRTVSNPLIKDTLVFIKYGAETEGSFTDIEVTLAPGADSTLHYHSSYMETFSAVNDKVHLRTGRKAIPIVLDPGESRTIEKKEYHCFFNPTDEEIKFKVTVRPASLGFEKMLYFTYGLSRDGFVTRKGKISPFELAAMSVVLGDTHLASWKSGLVSILSKAVYGYMRWRGVEEELLEKYWR